MQAQQSIVGRRVDLPGVNLHGIEGAQAQFL
jgi:hypothetical protein